MAANLDLTGDTIASSFDQLLHIGHESLIEAGATAHYITNGTGTQSALSISTTRVGIGLESPDHPLEIKHTDTSAINGTNIASNSVLGLHIDLASDTDNAGSVLKLTSNSDTCQSAIAHIQEAGEDSNLAFYTDNNGTLTEAMRIGNNQKVGIGLTASTTTLSILGEITIAKADDPYIAFTDANQTQDNMAIIYDTGLDALLIKDQGGGANLLNVKRSGNVGIGTVAPAALLELDQAAIDTAIMKFVSNEVDHGMTDLVETDCYGAFIKADGEVGGLHIAGFSDDDGSAGGYALFLDGSHGEAADTTKSTLGVGVIALRSHIKSSAGASTVGTDGNLVVIQNASTTRFIFDAEGEMHSDAIIGVGEDWDEWSDLQMASDLSRLPKAKFNEMMKYKAEDFERAGLLTLSTDEDGSKHAFIKHKAMLMFAMCCFGETYKRISTLEEQNKYLVDELVKNNVLKEKN